MENGPGRVREKRKVGGEELGQVEMMKGPSQEVWMLLSQAPEVGGRRFWKGFEKEDLTQLGPS